MGLKVKAPARFCLGSGACDTLSKCSRLLDLVLFWIGPAIGYPGGGSLKLPRRSSEGVGALAAATFCVDPEVGSAVRMSRFGLRWHAHSSASNRMRSLGCVATNGSPPHSGCIGASLPPPPPPPPYTFEGILLRWNIFGGGGGVGGGGDWGGVYFVILFGGSLSLFFHFLNCICTRAFCEP